MGTLNGYMQATQRFLREQKQDFIDPDDLIGFVNRSRRETAMRTKCLRGLTPISGQIVSWTIENPGSGYSTTPTLTITPPDFPSGVLPKPNGDQATATAIVTGGKIASIQSQYGGQGYWQPQMTITDPTGHGATAVPVMAYINQLQQGQEVYPFSSVDLRLFPGAASIFTIRSVSILFSGFRYSLACYDFSTYQSLVRQWALQWQYVPVICAQYGQGTGGSFYMYPIPSQPFQMEWDCFFLPSDLVDDQSYDPIPDPWCDSIPYFAAHLGYLSLQNLNAAKFYLDLYDTMVGRHSSYARPGRAVNPYGRI
jgi:hypothetical protein